MKQRYLFLGVVFVSLVVAPALASAEDVLPRISFEQTVCDLGQVGLGTKNSCEFKFTNTGQGALKISNVKSTCGCTVAQLEKKEYAPGESGCSWFCAYRWSVSLLESFCQGDAGVEEIAVHPVCVGGASSCRLNTLTSRPLACKMRKVTAPVMSPVTEVGRKDERRVTNYVFGNTGKDNRA